MLRQREGDAECDDCDSWNITNIKWINFLMITEMEY